MKVVKIEEAKVALLGPKVAKEARTLFSRCIATNSCACSKCNAMNEDEKHELKLNIKSVRR